ncbi:MAG: glutaredoxin domain-containing protein [Bdellovibrionales bacterium]
MNPKIVIYSKKLCPYCVRAKEFFKQKNIVFEEIDLTDNYDEIENLKKRTGHMTMPQIFIDDVFIGGYTDLVAKIDNGELKL